MFLDPVILCLAMFCVWALAWAPRWAVNRPRSLIQSRTPCSQCCCSDYFARHLNRVRWQLVAMIIIGGYLLGSVLCWACITLHTHAGQASLRRPSSEGTRRSLFKGAGAGLPKQVSLCTLTWPRHCKWRPSFAAGPGTRPLPQPVVILWPSFPRVASQVVRMGLPVTVQIGDASEDEISEQLHNSPERAAATRRSRAMTPPPRVVQARPAGRRPKIDGTSVLSQEARAHLGSVGGSAVAGGAGRSEGPRRGQQRRKPVTWCSWLWKSGGKVLKRLRALLLWSCVAYVLAAGPLREMLMPIQRLLASTASVGESAAGALSSILDGGTQLVTASTSAVRAASFNTLGVAHAAWIGVDLVDMNATKIVGRVMGDDASAIEQWLLSEHGREVFKSPAEEALLFWQGLLHSQTFHLPVVAAETEALVASGDYWVASGVVSYASSWSSSFASCAWFSRPAGPTLCGSWRVGMRRMSTNRFFASLATLPSPCPPLTVHGIRFWPPRPPLPFGALCSVCFVALASLCWRRAALGGAFWRPCGCMGPCIRWHWV